MIAISDRRALERFDLHAPMRIEVDFDGGRKDVLNLTTQNISSAGAYIVTERPLPEGVEVRLELILSLELLKTLIGERRKAKIRVRGKVIRSDCQGMAIVFKNKYRIMAGNGVGTR